MSTSATTIKSKKDIEEYLRKATKEMMNGNFDFTDNGKCIGCGECCGNFLPLQESDIIRIKRFLKKHTIKEKKHILPTSLPTVDNTCPFRDDKEKKCLIYSIRPTICRDYKCDKPKQGLMANMNMYHGPCRIVDMRKEFFGR